MELLFAFLILFLEGILHLIWFLFPLKSVQKHLLSKFKYRDSDVDASLNYDFMKLVEHHGYEPKEYYTTTKDGYVLTIHRILPKNSSKKIIRGSFPPTWIHAMQ
jgi:hypothetical protein